MITAAALSWNIAFEKAGFSNAIVVKPTGRCRWDAGDIRYNVLRGRLRDPPFGGYGLFH